MGIVTRRRVQRRTARTADATGSLPDDAMQDQAATKWVYSHSIVAGGLLDTS